MADVGYLRVSTIEQKLDRQEVALSFCEPIFKEKLSGKCMGRPELLACIDYCRDGDVLHIHSIDRLARNLTDLQTIVTQLNDKGVTVKFHKENMLFADNPKPMEKLQFQIMGAFAEFERMLIRERQAEGIKIAKEKDKNLPLAQRSYRGRKAMCPDLKNSIMEQIKAGVSCKIIAVGVGLNLRTIQYFKADYIKEIRANH